MQYRACSVAVHKSKIAQGQSAPLMTVEPLPSPRIKRPSISLDDIFNASFHKRLRWFLIVSIPVFVALQARSVIWVSTAYSIVAGLAANASIPGFGRLLLHAGRKGADLNKTKQPILPESLGIAVGAIYLVTMFLFIPVPFAPWLGRQWSVPERAFPFEKLGAYTSALLSITCMLFLGFADDVLNLKWRHKILVPAISSLPLLMIYSVTFGRTEVVVPVPLRGLFGPLLQLGLLYYVYMAMLAIFCTHSINILAGVNGVEVGQSIIIASSVALHNLVAIMAGEPVEEHLFSLSLILPFLAVSLALLRHNWWPAKVFVGDTFCYFAGMTFAVVGILGHFGKTLLLFFIPQIFNFLYSLPQLAGLVPCPRHRMPQLNERGLLETSQVTFKLTPRNRHAVRMLSSMGLLRIYDQQNDQLRTNNFTLLNLLLVWMGPLREDHLSLLLMGVQALCCCAAFIIRHFLARYFFPAAMQGA